MTPKQQKTIAIGAAVAALVAALGYFAIIKPAFASSTTLRSSATLAEEQAATAQGRLAELTAKKADLTAAQEQVDALFEAFPASYKQDEWIDMVSATADSADVKITSVTPTAPVDASLQVDPATGLPVAGATSTTTPPATEGESTATPATPTGATGAVPGSAGATSTGSFPLAQSTITITATGSVPNLHAFVAALSQMRRPLLIDAITISNDSDEASISIVGKTLLSRPLNDPLDGNQSSANIGGEKQ